MRRADFDLELESHIRSGQDGRAIRLLARAIVEGIDPYESAPPVPARNGFDEAKATIQTLRNQLGAAVAERDNLRRLLDEVVVQRDALRNEGAAQRARIELLTEERDVAIVERNDVRDMCERTEKDRDYALSQLKAEHVRYTELFDAMVAVRDAVEKTGV